MITFKRTSVIFLSSLFLLVGCQEETIEENNLSVAGIDVEVEQNENHEHGNELVSYKESEITINNLDDLNHYSDTIIIGTVLDEVTFSANGTYKYSVSVDNALKGPAASDTIDVYVFGNILEVEKQYALFLGYWESELYPKPVYNLKDDSLIIEVQQNNLIGAEKIVEGKTTDELIRYIIGTNNDRKKAKVLSDSPEFEIIDKLNNLEDLVSLSENILHIIPNEIIHENLYVRSFNATIVDVLKGSITDEQIFINLPSTVETGNEYIIFLKKGPEKLLVTREGSVVSKEDEKTWQAILI